MEIKYKFNDGTESIVEVCDEIGNFITNSRKAEQAGNRRERYHCISLDAAEYEGFEMSSGESAESVALYNNYIKEFYETYETLTDVQKRRVEMKEEGLTYREIARREGVSDHKKIIKSINQVGKKFEKFK
jgi:hypothetical protein